MKIIFSKKDKKKLHPLYRSALIDVVSIINKFSPNIFWNPSYPFYKIELVKRAEDKRSPLDE